MELYQEWEADHINYNIEEYSPNELIQILEIVVPNEESILKKTNYFIEKFENENKPELSSFLGLQKLFSSDFAPLMFAKRDTTRLSRSRCILINKCSLNNPPPSVGRRGLTLTNF